MLFRYATIPHVRRHGPQGYLAYRSYKPWLRDEFHFRCVYCLCHERWFPDGDDSFSVDHIRPGKRSSGLEELYDNLVYACCQCNASKQDACEVIDPCQEPFGHHVEVLDDGTIQGHTSEGVALIRICRLDRQKLTVFRRGILALWHTLTQRHDPEAVILHHRFFGLPVNIPDLTILRPPGGNSRPQGIVASYFVRQQPG